MAVKETLKKVAQAIAWPFVHLFKALFPGGAAQALKIAANAALATPLGQIVWQAVQDIQNSMPGADGDAKRIAAVGTVIAAATQTGVQWKQSLINLLIELAVQRLKGTV